MMLSYGSRRRWNVMRRINLIILLSVVFSGQVFAADCQQSIASAASIQGSVETRSTKQSQWRKVKLGDKFCPGDILRVLNNSRASILLNNDTLLRLKQNSTITFTGLNKDKESWLDLSQGVAHFIARIKQAFKVVTPFVNASVEGTEFVVSVAGSQARVTVFEGQVAALNDFGQLMLVGGQSAIANQGQAPVIKALVKPRDAVNWALYYPAILAYDINDFDGLPEQWYNIIEKSIKAYRENSIDQALSTIAELPKNLNYLDNASIYVYRASLALNTGRDDLAAADLSRALDIDAQNVNAIALQAMIAIVQNDKARGMELALNAVNLAPSNATALLAMSYAQQAYFNIPDALKSMQQAVQAEPDNALAWSRLSELYLMSGELDKALNAALKAQQLNPQQARSNTVLGYAYLVKNDALKAQQSFNNAIEHDSTDPLARLGLGLSKIRQGYLADGRRELEFAASLDPNNSLIRSYLGKAYFEENRNKVAAIQFEMAKQLDPNDPTPWLYSALQKQSQALAVQGLRELEQSITKNNNRATYRSKFLLEQDQATRSSNMGSIYRDLGFEHLALIEGWKSVNENPLNYSAHQLLADTYSVKPRHEFARVNEFHIANILRPKNIQPVDALNSSINAGRLSGTGFNELSYNEYTSLFDSNGNTARISAADGSNDTSSYDFNYSGVHDGSSFSVGTYHYQTDGFRENNDQKQSTYYTNLQTSLSNTLSFGIDFNHTKTERGDLELRATGAFDPDTRQDEEVDTFKLSFNNYLNNHSNILYVIGDQELNSLTTFVPGFFELDFTSKLSIADISYITNSVNYNLTAGITYRNARLTDDDNIFGVPSLNNYKIEYNNIYLYANLKPTDGLITTIAGSYDSLNDELINNKEEKFNPKLGLTWNPHKDITIRAAYFETLQRYYASTYTTDPSLEPTQVAGFNQLYQSTRGQESKSHGVGIDYRINNNNYIGLEILNRKTVPIIEIYTPDPILLKPDWKEDIFQFYLDNIIADNFSISTSYVYEKFNRESDSGYTGAESFARIETKRLPVSFNYFTESGIKFSLKATHVDQDGDYIIFTPFPTTQQVADKFWVYDLTATYKFPSRNGMLSLESYNITDEDFNFQDTDPVNPAIYPDRYWMLKFMIKI